MKQPKELSDWNFSDTIQIPDGYDLQSIPDNTRNNFITLIEHHNNLVEVVNMLCEKRGIVFDE